MAVLAASVLRPAAMSLAIEVSTASVGGTPASRSCIRLACERASACATAGSSAVPARQRQTNALRHATERLKKYESRFCAMHGNFRRFPEILAETGVSGFDGMLVDLGVSSHQLDEPTRGFSFMNDGPLDLRMDQQSKRTAAELNRPVSARRDGIAA